MAGRPGDHLAAGTGPATCALLPVLRGHRRVRRVLDRAVGGRVHRPLPRGYAPVRDRLSALERARAGLAVRPHRPLPAVPAQPLGLLPGRGQVMPDHTDTVLVCRGRWDVADLPAPRSAAVAG